jgi:hypothetical protein
VAPVAFRVPPEPALLSWIVRVVLGATLIPASPLSAGTLLMLKDWPLRSRVPLVTVPLPTISCG